MSGTTTTTGTLGNAAPVSFPGIASGIDYNAIIQKYTALTLSQEAPTKAQINNLNSANTAILKIQNLFGTVQDSLTALSDPATFAAYKATVGNASNGSPAATASQIAGQSPVAGTYVINAQTVATSTLITNNPTANANINGAVAIGASGVTISATNGPNNTGKLTVNGTQFAYDVNTDTIGAIVGKFNAIAGVTATLNANNTISLTGITSLGSGGDQGNLLQVLKLDVAPLVAGNVTSAASISGINASTPLSATNNAGFATAVTNGTFTINGVQFTINTATDALSDIIKRINSSSAGVNAAYDAESASFTLTSKVPGPQSILVGSGTDTSNFLSASGVTTGTTTAGTQAQVTFTDSVGSHTVYSATNDFTNVIAGVDLKVTASSGVLPPGSTFYTVNVAPDATAAEKAIKTFTTAYNAAIDELTKDLAAPVVVTTRTGGSTQATQGAPGGVLYGNFQVSNLRTQLISLVSGFIPTGSTSYNSLSTVGLKLDSSSETVGVVDSNASSSSSSSSSTTGTANNSVTVTATSGRLQDLDVTKFEAAYAADPSSVQKLFTLTPQLSSTGVGTVAAGTAVSGSGIGFTYLIGSLLANADGTSTFLKNTLVSPPSLNSALFQSITNANSQRIKSLQDQIALIDSEATQQADALRAQFSASESQIAQLQALQSTIASIGH